MEDTEVIIKIPEEIRLAILNDNLSDGQQTIEVASVFEDATIIESDNVESEDLPPVTPQSIWTPVSDGLPKENGWYQCTITMDDDLLLTMDLYYKNGKWLDNRAIKMFNTYDIYGYGYDNSKEKHKLSYQELISEFDWTENVIAWAPSPEPYKPESER